MKTGQRVRTPTKARKSLTGCVVFASVVRGKVLIFAEECSKKMAADIRKDFGDDLILVVNQGGNINGSTHLRCT